MLVDLSPKRVNAIFGRFGNSQWVVFRRQTYPGVVNNTADGLSRWSRDSITTNLIALRLGVPWHEEVIRGAGNRFCSNILDSSLPDDLSRDRLSRLAKDILGHSFGSAVR